MLYTERNKLTVIELAEMKDTLAFHELEDILWERPASTVYIEVAGLLYGVVSIGDINRSYEGGKDCVNINKKFIFIQPGQSMLARQIFKERERICAIPVVNTAGKIIGDYTRWNDLMYLDCKNFFHNKHVKLFLKENRHMALVKPNDIFPEKRRLLLEWKSMLEEQGVVVDIIDRKQIYEYFDKVDRILFTDEHELRGTHCVYTSVLQKAFDRCKAVTYKEFIYAFNQIVINDFLSMIQKQGVHLLTYSYEENENGYKEKLEQKIGENFNVLGLKRTKRILSKMKKGFLEEIYNEEYEKSFMPFPFSVTIENSIPKLKDMEEPLTHVKNGERVTIGQPADYDRCIYFYGACDVFGWWVEDKHTMESWLQDKLNQMGFACKVINCGVFLQDIYTEIDRVETTPLKKGDIVVMADYKYVAVNSDSHINMINVFEKNNVHAPWFADCCGHFNYKVNKICAGAIFDKLLPILQKTVDDRRLVTKDNDLVSSIYINRYFADFKPQKYNKIGAIVMNGDPFTAGHRYLIQEALKSVDFLIIFVIENGEFLFTFEERYSMLCGGVEDLRNVMVVPSGRYIVIKEPMSEIWNHVQKIENMLVLFAQAIAKRLNITHCFVGEEIEDSTANKYNKKMKKILPLYGISVIEIPRKRHGKNIISSTYVQKCIEMGNECLLDEILPDSTKQMLHN